MKTNKSRTQKCLQAISENVEIAISPTIGKPRLLFYTHKRLSYEVLLSSENQYKAAINQAIVESIRSDWFKELTDHSQRNYLYIFSKFTEWLDGKDFLLTENSRYECLNEYRSYRLNVSGAKHCINYQIKALMFRGLGSSNLSTNDVMYLKTLLRNSKTVKYVEGEGVSLERWFAIPWLKEVIGEKYYLQLASPKRLLLSFRVTVAVTLLYLLECRQQWRARDGRLNLSERNDWRGRYGPDLMCEVGHFTDDGTPADSVTLAAWHDLVAPNHYESVQRLIANNGCKNLPARISLEGKQHLVWRRPTYFLPEHFCNYSRLEERLISWLAACEAIQPTDIAKLKSTDFAIEINAAGRLLMIQTQYYKGRAGNVKNPEILSGSHCWTVALFEYLKNLPSPGKLIRSNLPDQKTYLPRYCDGGPNVELAFLFRLWETPFLKARILSELSRAGSTPIFVHAMLALVTHGGENLPTFRGRTGKNKTHYLQMVDRPVPNNMFTLMHIKTSAVYAASDRYRDADLINHSSHTSQTELRHYLTDANKEWVNQCGRITRQVLHDLQNTVFQPSVDRMRKAVEDLNLRTQIVKATGLNDAKVISISDSFADDSINHDEIIVSDTVESALYFLHYINEAINAASRLLVVRPDFVERTLLVKIEWMNQTLMRLKSTKLARIEYDKIRDFLPKMFDHLLETTE